MVNKGNPLVSLINPSSKCRREASLKCLWQMPHQISIFQKKGQFKIQQMAFTIIALVLFFVLVGLLVFSFKFASIKDSATVLNEKNALLLSTKIANSPEFSCGESFGNLLTNCIDADKVMILKEFSSRYNGFWGNVPNIIIEVVYPKSPVSECTKANYPNCNKIKLFDSESGSFYQPNFVSLCKKININGEIVNKCELAKIYVGYEKENE